MDDDAISNLFQALYKDIPPEDQFHIAKPLLAHYTSLEALEKILQNNEVWFSNPLFVNDLDEVKFGILHGVMAIKGNEHIRTALKTDNRYRTFAQAMDYYINDFDEKHLLDTYVFVFLNTIRGTRMGRYPCGVAMVETAAVLHWFSICRNWNLLRAVLLLFDGFTMVRRKNDLDGLIK